MSECEWREEGARRTEGPADAGGMPAKKLEPHTEMWGTKPYHIQIDQNTATPSPGPVRPGLPRNEGQLADVE